MALDGAERRKQRIDALSDHILESGRHGCKISEVTVWAQRQHGLTAATARSYIDTLLEAGEIILAQGDGHLRHINVLPSKTATP